MDSTNLLSRGLKAIQATHSPDRHCNQATEPLGSRRLISFLAFAAVLTAAFSLPLVSLAKHAATADLHSHIVLIPFISAYLLFIRRKIFPENMSSPGWTVLLLIAGIAALLAATGVHQSPLSQERFPLVHGACRLSLS